VLNKPDGTPYGTDAKSGNIVETKPHFYEWATATTGMLAVARKQRSTFRNYVAAETAAPVIACAAGKGPLDELDFQFAGIVRSNSVRTMDDGVGPTTDEYFTCVFARRTSISVFCTLPSSFSHDVSCCSCAQSHYRGARNDSEQLEGRHPCR